MKRLLRQIALRVLDKTNRDISIRHHWVAGAKVRLNSFKHKGYWYNGRKREAASMEIFALLVRPGMSVAEVGGHIGYISRYFAHLVGITGKLVVFEPGSNNLPYIRSNVGSLSNVHLVEKGVGPVAGNMDFYEESLTGQNNSFIKDFKGLSINEKAATKVADVHTRKVDIVTLDAFFAATAPDFVKIDVEGFEYQVLLGAETLLARKTMFMVEVQADKQAIYDMMRRHGYVLVSEIRKLARSADDLHYNTFCLHPVHHKTQLALLGL